jgi:ribosomal protein S6
MERAYESVLIIKNDTSDPERQDVVQKAAKKIESLGGKIVVSQVWIKDREFAGAIRASGAGRKKYTRGCYWLINFDLAADKLGEFKETIRLEERILRSLILARECHKEVSDGQPK